MEVAREREGSFRILWPHPLHQAEGVGDAVSHGKLDFPGRKILAESGWGGTNREGGDSQGWLLKQGLNQ